MLSGNSSRFRKKSRFVEFCSWPWPFTLIGTGCRTCWLPRNLFDKTLLHSQSSRTLSGFLKPNYSNEARRCSIFFMFSILHSWDMCFINNAGTFVHNHSRHPTNQKLHIDNTRHKKGRKRNQVALSGAQKVRWSNKTNVNCQFLKNQFNQKSARSQKKCRFRKISHNSKRAIVLHAFKVLGCSRYVFVYHTQTHLKSIERPQEICWTSESRHLGLGLRLCLCPHCW